MRILAKWIIAGPNGEIIDYQLTRLLGTWERSWTLREHQAQTKAFGARPAREYSKDATQQIESPATGP